MRRSGVLGLVVSLVLTGFVTLISFSPLGAAGSAAAAANSGDAGAYVPLTPANIVDTRTALGGVQGPVAAGSTTNFTVAGQDGIPTSGVSAVAISVSYVGNANAGSVVVYPSGQSEPGTANMVLDGFDVTNTVMTPLGANGQVSVKLYSQTGGGDFVVSAQGYYQAAAAGVTASFTPVAPGCRPVNLTNFSGTTQITPGGSCGVPTSGVSAVAINVTMENPEATEDARVWPVGASQPDAPFVEARAHVNTAGFAIAALGNGGAYNLNVGEPSVDNLYVDVQGYFSTNATADPFAPLAATRVFDTRSGLGTPGGSNAQFVNGTIDPIQITGNGGVPASGVAAVAVTVSGLSNTSGPGDYLTVWPAGSPFPDGGAFSDVNIYPNSQASNTVIVPVGTGGQIMIGDSQGPVNVVVDIDGYYDDSTTCGLYSSNNIQVCDPIRTEYLAQGGPSVVGEPTGPAQGVANGIRQDFANNWSIYLENNHSTAYSVHGTVLTKFNANTGTSLGFPNADQASASGGGGWVYQSFDGHTNDRIYANGGTAYSVKDAYADGYARGGFELGVSYDGGNSHYSIGLPTQDSDAAASLLNGHTESFANGTVYVPNAGGGTGSYPRMSVNAVGDKGDYSFDTIKLTDQLTLKTNEGDGDLLAEYTGISLPGITGALPVGVAYNSLKLPGASAATTSGNGSTGVAWNQTTSPDLMVRTNSGGSVTLFDATGGMDVFATAGGGKFTHPAGLDATLTGTASTTYVLTMSNGKEKYTFDGPTGHLNSDADRQGNATTFGYNTASPPALTSFMGSYQSLPDRITVTTGTGQVSLGQSGGSISRTLTYKTNGGGDLSEIDEPNGGVYALGYDGFHDLTSVTDPRKVVTSLSYDPFGRVASITRDPSGVNATSYYKYGTAGANTVSVTDPDGNPATVYTRDTTASNTDARISIVTDGRGKMQDKKHYTSDDGVDQNTNAYNSITSNTYSAGVNNGETPTMSASGLGATSSASYVTSGSSKDCGGAANSNAGTDPYEMATSTDSNSSCSTYSYDGPGNLTSSKNANAAIAYVNHNSDGTPNFTTDPNNVGHAGNGQTCTETGMSAADNCSTYLYQNHQLMTTYPVTGSGLGNKSFTYDGILRQATYQNGKGVTATSGYDLDDRTTKTAYSDSTHEVDTTYDVNGNVTKAVDAAGTTYTYYDTLNRLRERSTTDATGTCLGGSPAPSATTTCYTYDKAGNLLTLADARGTVSYHYNGVNEVDQLTEATGRRDLFGYDDAHHRTDTWDNATGTNSGGSSGPTYSGGTAFVITPPAAWAVHTVSTINNDGNLIELKTQANSASVTTVSDLCFDYTTSTTRTASDVCTTKTKPTSGTMTGKVHRRIDNMTGSPMGTIAYTYDPAGRLLSAVGTTGTSYAYGYDLDGNRVCDATYTGTTAMTCANVLSHTFHAYNAANQFTDTGAGYDPDGNLTAGAGNGYAYNGTDQTTSFTPMGAISATTVGYFGSSQNERSSFGATTYSNGPEGVQAMTASGSTTYYDRTPDGTLIGEHGPDGDFYYAFDNQGSITAIISTNGTATSGYRYDPYGAHIVMTGNTTVGNDNPWRYTGAYLDRLTGQYHLGARYYDPSTGRFTQQDSIDHLADPTQGNKYAYAGADPINNTDPSGNSLFGDALQVVGQVAGIASSATFFADATGAPEILAGIGTVLSTAGTAVNGGDVGYALATNAAANAAGLVGGPAARSVVYSAVVSGSTRSGNAN